MKHLPHAQQWYVPGSRCPLSLLCSRSALWPSVDPVGPRTHRIAVGGVHGTKSEKGVRIWMSLWEPRLCTFSIESCLSFHGLCSFLRNFLVSKTKKVSEDEPHIRTKAGFPSSTSVWPPCSWQRDGAARTFQTGLQRAICDLFVPIRVSRSGFSLWRVQMRPSALSTSLPRASGPNIQLKNDTGGADPLQEEQLPAEPDFFCWMVGGGKNRKQNRQSLTCSDPNKEEHLPAVLITCLPHSWWRQEEAPATPLGEQDATGEGI